MKLVKDLKFGEVAWVNRESLFVTGDVPQQFCLLAQATVAPEPSVEFNLPIQLLEGGFVVGKLVASEEVRRFESADAAQHMPVLSFVSDLTKAQEVLVEKTVAYLRDGEVGYVSPEAIYTTGFQPAVFYVRSKAPVAPRPIAGFTVAVRRQFDVCVVSKLEVARHVTGECETYDLPVLRFDCFNAVAHGSGEPKLFVSFTSALWALKRGDVSDAELQKGLFIFGCTRSHAITPGANGEFVEEVVRERPDLHEKLVKALLQAEATGRVNWRDASEPNVTFELVDDLLVRNGFHPLMGEREYEALYGSSMDRWHYNYPTVARRSAQLAVVL